MKTGNYIRFDKHGGVEISVSLFTFKEGDVYIAYSFIKTNLNTTCALA